MSQLPAGQLPFSAGAENDRGVQDTDISSETLPSAGHSSDLSPAMRQQLEAQFQASGGNVDAVAQDLRARIAQIDAQTVAEDDPQHVQIQAQRALYVAQVSYLEDHLAVHGIDRSRGAQIDQYEDTVARTASEPLSSTSSSSRGRRVRVYDTRS